MDDFKDIGDAPMEDSPARAAERDRVVFRNARVVLADRVTRGAVVVEDGRIVEIVEGTVAAGGDDTVVDCDGDILMPGMVELHTDNIEKHVLPRPGAFWPPLAAAIAHDAQIIGAGITTVYDAVAVGAFENGGVRLKMLGDICDALEEGAAHHLFKAEHLLHLRCEIAFEGLDTLLEPLIERAPVGMVSIMDHTPGQRQFVDVSKYRLYYQAKHGFTDAEMDAYMEDRRRDQALYSDTNRAYAAKRARDLGLAIASHDDATEAHVAEAVRDGMTIAEFPTTLEAAKASHEAGLAVLMGAPNLVRGGSHSGNVAARDLAERGHLDIVSSDYAPASLIHAAFLLEETVEGIDLPAAVAMVTRTPARAAGLTDRGEIAVGLKADLVRVFETNHHPVLRGVWRDGHRVA
jgi:alpha-D-ribose 1-methylphosphonate 5-triphosphate diphosphatase